MPITPSVIIFDVNETLSDMSPMAHRFTDVGVPAELAKLWFAALLRDGFALTASGSNVPFAVIGAAVLHDLLDGMKLNRTAGQAAAHIMDGMSSLSVHPDIPEGARMLSSGGIRLVTLSNGSARIAEKLFTDAGIRDRFEALLSVEDAPAWKPSSASYDYAAAVCGTDPAQMMLVAVHPWDIHGAAHAGLRTAWINRGGQSYPPHFEAPDVTVTALTELPAALVTSD